MDIEKIDFWCDRFESELKNGETSSVDAFLNHHNLSQNEQLISELKAVYEDFRDKQIPPEETVSFQTPGLDSTRAADATTSLSPTGKEIASARVTLPHSDFPGYKLIEVLGRGGMGVVYKARQVKADRIVALKMILNLDEAEEEDIKRFQIEAQASAALQHPGIVQVYDVGINEDDVPFFTQEYLSGGTLSRKISKQLLSHEEAARKLIDLSNAIAYAHSKGIVHRDLKPSNILIAEDGALKIADFGLARRLDDQSDLTRDGSILGTPSYMAPEQASGSTHEIGPLCDVYALGAILYELLTGRAPFKGASVWEVINLVRDAPPTPPSELQPGVPKDLETICLKCLSKDPESRYASAKELADDLNRYVNHEPILARPISQWGRLVRLCQRFPREARLVGVVTSLLLVLAVGGTAGGIEIFRLNEQSDRLNEQSEDRLANFRKAVSKLVNEIPQLLDGIPLANGARQGIAEITLDLNRELENTIDDIEIGIARERARVASNIRSGNIHLTNAVISVGKKPREEVENLFDLAEESFQEAEELAKSGLESGEGDRAKALANLALTKQRLAALAVENKDFDEASNLYQDAIDLRRQAAELPDGEEPQARRIAELGKAHSEKALFLHRQSQETEDPDTSEQLLSLSVAEAGTAREKLVDALKALPEEDEYRINLKRDLASAALIEAFVSSAAGEEQSKVIQSYELAIQTNAALIDEDPNRFQHKRNLLECRTRYGDYLMVECGDVLAARIQYVQAYLLHRTFWFDEVLFDLRDGETGLAKLYYRISLADNQLGNPEKATKFFRRSELIRDLDLQQFGDDAKVRQDPDSILTPRINLMLSQARSGNTEPALQEARRLMERAEDPADLPVPFKQEELYLQAAAVFGIVAQQEQDKTLLAQAIDAMGMAISAGFDDRDYLQNDPDLLPLQESPEFGTLMDQLPE